MQLRGRIYCGVYTVVYILWCVYWTVYVGVCIGAVADSVVFLAGSAYRCTVAGEGSEIFSKIASNSRSFALLNLCVDLTKSKYFCFLIASYM